MTESHDAAALELSAVYKSFNRYRVLNGLSLRMNYGDFALLLGANGSGKSTLLRVCTQLGRADKGEVLLEGKSEGFFNPRMVGHAGHNLFVYGNLTVKENIALFRDLSSADVNLDAWLEEWQLAKHASKKIFELSKGLQYRTSLCRALLCRPRFLFLDEPTSSLDEKAVKFLMQKIREIFAENKERGFVLIATHDLKRVEKYSNRVMVLKDGIIAKDLFYLQCESQDKSLEELKREVIEYYLEANR